MPRTILHEATPRLDIPTLAAAASLRTGVFGFPYKRDGIGDGVVYECNSLRRRLSWPDRDMH